MIEWLINNWSLIVKIALLLYGAAKIITNLTPSDRDNQILAKIVETIEKFIDLLIPNLKKDGGTHSANWINLLKKKK